MKALLLSCSVVTAYVAQTVLAIVVCAFLAWLLSGCAMTKPGMTPDGLAKDKYECEHEAYASTQGAPTLVASSLYRDCMRARGYR